MMIIFLLTACLHKTSLVGVIDNSEPKKCTVELSTGELVLIESSICDKVLEGKEIIFYARSK